MKVNYNVYMLLGFAAFLGLLKLSGGDLDDSHKQAVEANTIQTQLQEEQREQDKWHLRCKELEAVARFNGKQWEGFPLQKRCSGLMQ